MNTFKTDFMTESLGYLEIFQELKIIFVNIS